MHGYKSCAIGSILDLSDQPRDFVLRCGATQGLHRGRSANETPVVRHAGTPHRILICKARLPWSCRRASPGGASPRHRTRTIPGRASLAPAAQSRSTGQPAGPPPTRHLRVLAEADGGSRHERGVRVTPPLLQHSRRRLCRDRAAAHRVAGPTGGPSGRACGTEGELPRAASSRGPAPCGHGCGTECGRRLAVS